MHVRGSQDKDVNPRGSDHCERLSPGVGKRSVMNRLQSQSNCSNIGRQRSCKTSCLTGRGAPCLYTLMGAVKLFTIMSIARAAGVTHIVEEGREGGLSAYLYWLHGFQVTSIEYLPIDEVSSAMQSLAPSLRMLDGDGHKLVPNVIDELGPHAARTLVIFDGEKRGRAYSDTFTLIRDKVALAMFDDSDVRTPLETRNGQRPEFHNFLDAQRDVWWEFNKDDEKIVSPLLAEQRRAYPNSKITGAHACIFVRGGAWK